MDSTDVEELLCPESGIVSDFQEIDRILAMDKTDGDGGSN